MMNLKIERSPFKEMSVKEHRKNLNEITLKLHCYSSPITVNLLELSEQMETIPGHNKRLDTLVIQ